jgi:hypothetical protein
MGGGGGGYVPTQQQLEAKPPSRYGNIEKTDAADKHFDFERSAFRAILKSTMAEDPITATTLLLRILQRCAIPSM